jgi:hypothetical protein
MTDQVPSKDQLRFSWTWDANARNWLIGTVDMGDGLLAGYDHFAGYYERRLIEEIERLRVIEKLYEEQCEAGYARGSASEPHDESQCWEPCGELGKSAEHARVAPEPETAPTAWMRGHRSYSPGEPDDYDVECVYGDDPPDDSGKWIPLYSRPAQPPRDGQ